MKKLVKKTKGLIRGTSTAVLLSVIIHAVLFFAAGVWVVFRLIDAPEAKFVPPPPVERPKMRLKKLRVKVKPTAKPRRTTQRITSKRKSTALPEIQLPEMTGMGAGLASIGGFEMMADMANMTIMGAEKSLGNDLEGTFYDFKQYRDGSSVPGMVVATGYNSTPPYIDLMNRFLEENWSPRVFSEYYKSPRKLYATHFMMPPCESSVAPKIFGIDDPNFEAALWAIHYKGKIAHKKGGTFRFWGFGDDMLIVRVNRKVVLNASTRWVGIRDPDHWQSSSRMNRTKILGLARCRVGDWFTLLPGETVEMEVLMGEVPGGMFQAMILVEEQGVEYPENDQGTPILPAFKTMKFPPHLIDEIKYTLVPGEADLEGGPIFSVY